MIRPSYRIGAGSATTKIEDILGVSAVRPVAKDLLEESGGSWRLKEKNLVHWSSFIDFGGKSKPQFARKIDPLISDGELYEKGEKGEPIRGALDHGRFLCRTPLWYYVLREAQVQKHGETLGEVGSRLVAETILGFLKHNPNSFWTSGYLNNPSSGFWSRLVWHGHVGADGIKVPGRRKPVAGLADMIDYAGLKK